MKSADGAMSGQTGPCGEVRSQSDVIGLAGEDLVIIDPDRSATFLQIALELLKLLEINSAQSMRIDEFTMPGIFQ